MIWRATGFALFGIGCVGLVLPLLPTTIFWILAALAFRKSHPEMAARIRAWPGVGPAISDFLDHGVVSPAGKRASLIAMALSAGLLALIGVDGLALGLSLACLAAAAIYVATRPSRAAATQPASSW